MHLAITCLFSRRLDVSSRVWGCLVFTGLVLFSHLLQTAGHLHHNEQIYVITQVVSLCRLCAQYVETSGLSQRRVLSTFPHLTLLIYESELSMKREGPTTTPLVLQAGSS